MMDMIIREIRKKTVILRGKTRLLCVTSYYKNKHRTAVNENSLLQPPSQKECHCLTSTLPGRHSFWDEVVQQKEQPFGHLGTWFSVSFKPQQPLRSWSLEMESITMRWTSWVLVRRNDPTVLMAQFNRSSWVVPSVRLVEWIVLGWWNE
jgi:hypothetical protein